MNAEKRTVDVDIDGVRWAVRVAGSGPAMLLLHGFTGSGRSWDDLMAAAIAAGFAAIAPDLPGHGGTAWRAPHAAEAASRDDPAEPGNASRATVERTADDLPLLLRAAGHERAHVVGYSMGARIALRLAVARPACVARLVLEAASAGIADARERSARCTADEALARTLERDGIVPFVDAWEATPVLAGEARLAPGARASLRAIRLGHDPAGLAASLRGAGNGAMEPLHVRLGEISSPTLVIVGGDDPARDRAAAVAAGIPGARLATIPGAGHAPHLEAPAAFNRLVLDFVSEEHVA
jgi:2-succinyl-6-hydroxy-2,4-cyclohexadiene-1-carboxylate synthase